MVREKQEETVTDEQAEDALLQVLGTNDELEATEVAPGPVVDEPSVTAEAAETTEAPVVEETDDVASLLARNDELQKQIEAEHKQNEERTRAVHERSAASEKIRHERHLRKSTAAARALEVLRASRTEAGASEADVDSVIGELSGTMNPASASYVEPAPTVQQPSIPQDDQAVIVNDFLNEKGLTKAEEDEFGAWVRGDAQTQMPQAEQALAQRDLDGFLRLAHVRWESSKQAAVTEDRTDAVNAAKSVQRTQREVGRAASTSTSAPRASRASAASTEVDVSKLTEDQVSQLLRDSTTQYQ